MRFGCGTVGFSLLNIARMTDMITADEGLLMSVSVGWAWVWVWAVCPRPS
jgi:hypothetical protein